MGTRLLLMKFTNDLAINKQADLSESLWDNTRRLKPFKIDQVALMTLNEFYRVVESIVVAVPKLEGNGYTCETVTVEYKWKPPSKVWEFTFIHPIPLSSSLFWPIQGILMKENAKDYQLITRLRVYRDSIFRYFTPRCDKGDSLYGFRVRTV
nr:ulp1 protease family, C-terminal catalytic domain-containing protein [Tanacetum cinerariifolium]